jgi:hypothetical protein
MATSYLRRSLNEWKLILNDHTVKDLIKKYPWLEYCGQTKLYKCKSCSEYAFSNNWTKGKHAVQPNRADEHLVSTQHKKATGVYLKILDQYTQSIIENTIVTTQQQIKHAEIASISRDVYFLAYNNLPLWWPTFTRWTQFGINTLLISIKDTSHWNFELHMHRS